MRRHVCVLLSAFALIGSVIVLGPRSDAAAKAPIKIQAGAMNENAPYEYNRFYPDVLRVHRGQTVQIGIFGFHTFTYSKVRHGFFRSDELPGTYAIPEQSVFGTDCGRGGVACVLTPKTTFAGSAVPIFSQDPVAVKVDLPPGRYTYFCQIHSTMSGTFQVVANSAPVPSQKQIDAQIASAVRRDTAAADAQFRRNQVPVSKVDADGVRTWRVLVGDATPDNHVQFLAYMPGTLPIAAGDRIRYEMRGAFKGDPHTVTFPAAAAGTSMIPAPNGLAGFSINMSCDPDDTTSGLPGVLGVWGAPGPFGAFPGCPANREIIWAPWMTSANHAPGDTVATPATYHDSAVLFPKNVPNSFRKPPGGPAFPSSFDANFPSAGTFTYACDVHGDFMTGTVEVT